MTTGPQATVRRLERAHRPAGRRRDRPDGRDAALVPRDAGRERSWVGLVAQAGVAAFVEWFRDPDARAGITADVFGTAPRELTRAVTLQQTVELVRVAIAVVEEHVDELAAPATRQLLREAVLRYSREIAFAAAAGLRRRPPRRAAPGTPGSRRSSSTPCCAARPTSRCARGPPRSAGAATTRSPWSSGTRRDAEPEAVVDEIRRAARPRGLDVLDRRAGRPAGRRRSAASTRRRSRATRCSVAQFGARAGGGRPGRAPTCSRPAASAAAALAGLRAAAAWPDAPRPVLGRRPAARARARRRPGGPARAGRRGLPTAASTPGRRPARDADGLPRAGRRRWRRRARCCSSTPTPCATGCAGSTEVTGVRADRPAAALRAAAGLALGRLADAADRTQRLCRNPPKPRHTLVGLGTAAQRHRSRQGGAVLVIVAPGQGAQTPGFLAPWLELPGVAGPLALAVRLRRPRPRRTTAPRPTPRTIRDTAVAQPLLVAAGLVAAARGLPAPGRRVRHGRRRRRAQRRRDHRRRRPPASSRAEQAMVLVRERGRAMAEAAAVTPTGMTAVLGGDPDEVLAALERARAHRRQRQRRRPGRRRRHARAARRARRPTRREGARLRPARRSPARSTPSTWRPRSRRCGGYAARRQRARPAHPAALQPRRRRRARRPRRAARASSTRSRNPVRWDLCMRTMADLGVTGVHRGAAGRHADRPGQARPARRRDRGAQDARRPRGGPRPGRAARQRRTPSDDSPTWRLLVAPGQGHVPAVRPADAGTMLEPGDAVGIRRRPRATSSRVVAPHGGTVVEWLVEDGDPVAPGQPLVRLHPEAVPA